MKKIAALFSIFILCVATNAYAKEFATIPSCSVTLNGQSVDNSYRQFPLLQYKDIVYFPMTYYDCRFLGESEYVYDCDGFTVRVYRGGRNANYRVLR